MIDLHSVRVELLHHRAQLLQDKKMPGVNVYSMEAYEELFRHCKELVYRAYERAGEKPSPADVGDAGSALTRDAITVFREVLGWEPLTEEQMPQSGEKPTSFSYTSNADGTVSGN